MTMSLALIQQANGTTLIAAFENGHASVHHLKEDGQWIMTYRSQAHSQPVLSMTVAPGHEHFFTSSADAIIAKHPIPTELQTVAKSKVDVEDQRVVEIVDEDDDAPNPSLLSGGLKGASASASNPPTTQQPWAHPLKVVNTKHAGQQGLDVRSDGRIFATAGWDSKARVYSCKTMKELAVLEWHKVGCYAVAFADVSAPEPSEDTASEGLDGPKSSESGRVGSQNRTVAAITNSRSLVKDRRVRQATMTHWLAAGAKDGKISLWDIY